MKEEHGEKKYVDSSLDLNGQIGDNDGKFSTQSTGFYSVATCVTLDASTLVMKACLKTDEGYYVDQTFELDLYLVNNGGTLGFNKP